MIAKTAHRIQKLLQDSGLVNVETKHPESFPSHDFSEETILITGAAGSIGSGLVHQLVNSSYKQLVLLDNAESSMYYLIKELELQHLKNVVYLISDIRDHASMERLFTTYHPTLIFHTAAYKHVPLMEDHPYEAVKLNILATIALAELAIRHRSKKFIFMSTDKAVNPTSVMGMTKSIAETFLDTSNTGKEPFFLTARFGNIFGSNGSIVPLFIKQIGSGDPLTITSNQVTRYFIDKNKACSLILKVAKLPPLEGSRYTFHMGEPIKIMDLAKAIAYAHNQEVQIRITGLKTGEKLHEELISDKEMLEATPDKDIYSIVIKKTKSDKPMDIAPLFMITPYHSISEIKELLVGYL